jgi:hypothetical protein
MKNIAFIFLLTLTYNLFAQVPQTIEIEVSGRPTWQKIIPLGKNGLIFFIKKDITKAIIARFDTDLKKVWESEIFLDAEKQPTSYTIDNEQVTFIFSENQGMYYQVYSIELKDGKFENKGFELREFFQDQNYVYFKHKIIMAGMNEKGASFYHYNFQENFGDFVSAELAGKVKAQYIKYIPQKNIIESLWSVKEAGYTNEKKKKGEFVKDAFVVYAKYDTSGKLILKNIIRSSAGNFPLTAQLTELDATTKIITGTYQSNTGAKGVFFAKIEDDKTTLTKFYDYSILLKGSPDWPDEFVKKMGNSFMFLPIQPIFSNNIISVGGTFYQPNYQSVTTNTPYYTGDDPYSQHSNYQHAQSKQVFKGFNFQSGFAANFDLEGNLLSQTRIDMNQLSPQLENALAINEHHAVAACIKGNLLLSSSINFVNPTLFKLSNELVSEKPTDLKNAQFLPTYHGVRNWYGNYFIADGSRIKFEAVKDNDAPKEKPSKRKKGQQQLPQTNIKKIIYLTKVLSSPQ